MEGWADDESLDALIPGVAERELTRRDLLKGAAVGGAVLMLPPAAWARDASEAAAPRPRRGGRLRVGMVGGGSSETLNTNQEVNEIDTARGQILYERLVDFTPDGKLYNRLASEFSANPSATVWKIKLRKGVLWHDGSKFTADDVVYTLRYILDQRTKSQGRADIVYMNPQNITKVDRYTVKIVLDQPHALVPTSLSSRAIYMFKNGTTNFDKPIGTGAFKFVSWTRGQRSLFARFDQYRRHGGPYLDELQIISIDDPTARLNALIAGQIDALVQLPATLVNTIKGNRKLRVLNSPSGYYTCQTMFADTAPFTDVRVRQAMRLLVDRKQIIQNALSGFGHIGNDLSDWFDPDYASHLPQRPHDPEKAKFLLKQAGRQNLTVSLATSDVAQAMLQSSTLIAEQAKQAGVTINIDNAPTDQYWTTRYLKSPFACTAWGWRPIDSQIAQALNKTAPFNETHWSNDKFEAITDKARRALDPKKRHALWVEAQTMLWNEGGYIIWGFANNIDALSAKVHGIKPSVARPLGWYNFTDAYLA